MYNVTLKVQLRVGKHTYIYVNKDAFKRNVQMSERALLAKLLNYEKQNKH